MITDWRVRWGEGYFPFFYGHIANFLKKDSLPAVDPWPEMREAQLMTLSLPNVAMASAIDLGETWDIHPRNKQDVAARLYLCAQSMAYGSKKEYMGPVYNGYKVEGDKIRIYFTHTGSGLKFRNFDKPAGFAIAGKDQKFVWADAVIDGNTVLVSAKTVSEPAAVRYGWSNNPDICLYNTEDLPASPFRTDDWPLMSFGKSRYFDLDFLK